MNKKTSHSDLRAPTTEAVNAIAPSATLALDGEFPLSASHTVSTPAPLAAHDVLQAAMAPMTGELAPDPAEAAGNTETAADTDAESAPAPAAVKKSGKKPAEKSSDKSVGVQDKKDKHKNDKKGSNQADQAEAGAAPADAPNAAARPAKIKFVKVTFSLTESEAELLDAMKKTHRANGLAIKKGQLLRAALLALADIDAERLAHLVAHLPAEPVAARKKKK